MSRDKFQYRLRGWLARHFRRPFAGGSEAGQGILEYILILVIILVVILGLVYQFNRKFRLYAEQFFDGYIACLLETGELPGVAGSSCDEEMKSIADMQAKGLLKFPDSAGGGGGNEKNAADQKALEDASRDKPTARNETVGGGGGGTTNWGNFGKNNGAGSSVGVGRTDVPKSDTETVGYSSTLPNSGAFGNYSNGNQRVTTTYVFENDDGAGDPKKGKPPVAKTDKKADNARALKPRRAMQDTTRRSTASVDVSEGDFSFGAMIRWLIIGALIVAIIVFFGGQLLQIMRSREKGGVE